MDLLVYRRLCRRWECRRLLRELHSRHCRRLTRDKSATRCSLNWSKVESCSGFGRIEEILAVLKGDYVCLDSQGLGFTVTTRDTSVSASSGGEHPFYIKTVLPRGPAKKDGRLRAGDRLLEMNGEPVGLLSQQALVQKLRHLRPDDKVGLLISRQEQERRSPTEAKAAAAGLAQLPRFLSEEPAAASSSPPPTPDTGSKKETLTFDVALNNSGSAGLGFSVKGRKKLSREKGRSGGETLVDYGIFVKTIMHGGAAHKVT